MRKAELELLAGCAPEDRPETVVNRHGGVMRPRHCRVRVSVHGIRRRRTQGDDRAVTLLEMRGSEY